jgi:hypothetical protein
VAPGALHRVAPAAFSARAQPLVAVHLTLLAEHRYFLAVHLKVPAPLFCDLVHGAYATCHSTDLWLQTFEALGRDPRPKPLPPTNPFSGAASGGGESGFRLTEDFLHHLASRVLKLGPAAQVTLGVSLCQSASPLLAAESARFLRGRVADYCASAPPPTQLESRLSPAVLHALVYLLHTHEVRVGVPCACGRGRAGSARTGAEAVWP